MAYEVARMITLPAVAAGSALLVIRYRGYGVAVSFLLGWVVLFAVYNIWPAPPTEWDEDREEILYTAPVLMGIWCTLVWGVVEFWRWLRRGRGTRV